MKKFATGLSLHQVVKSSVKPHQVLPSSKNRDMSASKSTSESVQSPQKSSNHGKVFPAGSSTSTPVSQSPLNNQALSRNLNHSSQKPGLSDRPSVSASLTHHQKATAAGPGGFLHEQNYYYISLM